MRHKAWVERFRQTDKWSHKNISLSCHVKNTKNRIESAFSEV